MKTSPKKYSAEFKRDALLLLQTSGKPQAEIERDLGLSHGLLRQWSKRFQVRDDQANLELSERSQLEAEIRQLKRENEVLRQEREILKKTITIFSEERRK